MKAILLLSIGLSAVAPLLKADTLSSVTNSVSMECRDYVRWKLPAAPQKGTPQYDAVAAAYAFRTPDRAAAFSNGWQFVEAVYGRDYSKECPPEIVIESYDSRRNPGGCGSAMQRVMDALMPGDLVSVSGTNDETFVLFYAGDVYGDRHGCALYPHEKGHFIVEHSAAMLVNWPAKGTHSFRIARGFRLLRPLNDRRICLSERRAFPRGETTISDDERVQAVLSLAWARFLKGPCLQYDSRHMVNADVEKRTGSKYMWRNDHRRTPEEATVDRTGYTVCSIFPYEVYWELFRYGLGEDSAGRESFNLTSHPAPAILVYKHDRKTNEKPVAQVLKEAWDALEPGDIIVYANVYDGKRAGHVLLYVGEVDGIRTVLHSCGQKFMIKSGYDKIEYDGTMHKDDAYGLLFALGKEGLVEKTLVGYDQFVILRPLKRPDLVLTSSGRARVKLPKFRYDRRVKGGLYGSVVSGAELQYGVELHNASRVPCDATVVETVPSGTEFLSASTGCAVEGRRLTWPITLAPGERRIVSWKVTVTAKPGERIVSGSGSAGGIPSNELTTEVVARTVTAEEAFAWATQNIRKGFDLPSCRVLNWAGGYASDTPPGKVRVHETRSRDLMVGDVVLSIPKRGEGESWRVWVKGSKGLLSREPDGRFVPVPEEDVIALMSCDFFMAFRPAAEF